MSEEKSEPKGKKRQLDERNGGLSFRAQKKQRFKAQRKEKIAAERSQHVGTKSEDPCPLCGEADAPYIYYGFETSPPRIFYKCGKCSLYFVRKCDILAPDVEAQMYRMHENDCQDQGYRHFLSRCTVPFVEFLKARSTTTETCDSKEETMKETDVSDIGLDFGCGPGPTVSDMLKKDGYQLVDYDPNFFPSPELPSVLSSTVQTSCSLAVTAGKTSIEDSFNTDFETLPESLRAQYAFVTCTEVVEHLRNPLYVWKHLFSLLRKGGVLAVMTGVIHSDDTFNTWYYHRDTLHIVFYHFETLKFVESLFDWKLVKTPHQNVAFFVKN